MIAYGGGGPVHAWAQARELGINRVLVPKASPAFSALGLLVSDLTAEFSRTCVQRHGRYNLDQLSQVYRELEREAVAWLAHERVPDEMRRLRRVASLRYEHQGFELTVPWTGEPGEVTRAVQTAFEDALHGRDERYLEWLDIVPAPTQAPAS